MLHRTSHSGLCATHLETVPGMHASSLLGTCTSIVFVQYNTTEQQRQGEYNKQAWACRAEPECPVRVEDKTHSPSVVFRVQTWALISLTASAPAGATAPAEDYWRDSRVVQLPAGIESVGVRGGETGA